MTERFGGGSAPARDPKELDRIEEALIQAFNKAREQFGVSSRECLQSVRDLNDFALRKPIRGNQKLMGLE